jgi:hypothetical protein
VYGCPEDPAMMLLYNYKLPWLKLSPSIERLLLNDKKSLLYEHGSKSFNFSSDKEKVNFKEFHYLDQPEMHSEKNCVSKRLALLLLANKEIFWHPEIWISWLTEARKYSYSLYLNRKGPYENCSRSAPFVPLYSIHINVANRKTSKDITRIGWRKKQIQFLQTFIKTLVGLLTGYQFKSASEEDAENVLLKEYRGFVLDQSTESYRHQRAVLGEILSGELTPSIDCKWGEVNPCQYELLRQALEESNCLGFVFLSESSVPLKPFSFIYSQWMKNPTSRFYFSNVNLPLVRKHHQWIILNRYHAKILVDNPEKWKCSAWLKHWYKNNVFLPAFAAPDEYLPFYALSEIVGLEKIWTQINNKQPFMDLYNFKNTNAEKDTSFQFQHTWVCWEFFEESIANQSCTRFGRFNFRFGSPVTFYWVDAKEITASLIKEPHVWFARKFDKNCKVGIEQGSIPMKTWLIPKLKEMHLNHLYISSDQQPKNIPEGICHVSQHSNSFSN